MRFYPILFFLIFSLEASLSYGYTSHELRTSELPKEISGSFRISEQNLHVVQVLRFSPNELSSLLTPDQVKVHSSDSLEIEGRGEGLFAVYGPYLDGVKGTYISAYFDYEGQFQPDQYRTCRKRDITQRCIEHNTHNYDHGFIIDLTANSGAKILARIDVKNDFSKAGKKDSVLTYHLKPHEVLDDVELRIHSIYGGTAKIKVSSAVFMIAHPVGS